MAWGFRRLQYQIHLLSASLSRAADQLNQKVGKFN